MVSSAPRPKIRANRACSTRKRGRFAWGAPYKTLGLHWALGVPGHTDDPGGCLTLAADQGRERYNPSGRALSGPATPGCSNMRSHSQDEYEHSGRRG